MNLLLKLVELAASKLDADYDIEVFEAHHRNKKDRPSGTALALGAAGGATGAMSNWRTRLNIPVTAIPARASRGSIGFSVFRGGDVVGDHTVTFAGIGERIELTHRASDRLAFARGAVTGRPVAGRQVRRACTRCRMCSAYLRKCRRRLADSRRPPSDRPAHFAFITWATRVDFRLQHAVKIHRSGIGPQAPISPSACVSETADIRSLMNHADKVAAVLALEDGTVFHGRSIGAKGTTTGEVVFNTAMTGYQEILT